MYVEDGALLFNSNKWVMQSEESRCDYMKAPAGYGAGITESSSPKSRALSHPPST